VGVITYSYSGIPDGCSSHDSFSVSCTPASAGNYTVRVYVNDSAGHSATATTNLTVTSSGGVVQPPPETLITVVAIGLVAAVIVVALVILLRRKIKSA
jgi:subtilase family serine protease